MPSINHIVSPSGNIVAIINNKHFQIPASHPNYGDIRLCLASGDASGLLALLDVVETVKVKTQGKIQIKGDKVYFLNEVLSGNLPDRIIEMLHKQQPVEAMCRFLENLMENPSNRSVECVYAFLEKKGFPLTEDGCFLGYKSVREDYTDHHTGKFDNSIGKVLEMRRNTVDENWQLQCSSGFHVGTHGYASTFGIGRKHIMIVKVNPRDVVSVPSDAAANKIRVCRYEVVGELEEAVIMTENLYTSAPVNPQPVVGGQFDNPTNGQWDDSDEGYEDDDDDNWDDDDDDFEDEDEATPESDGFGVKPSGQRFHNVRGPNGKFVKR